MSVPQIGKDVAAEYTKRTKSEPNRLIFQAADSLLSPGTPFYAKNPDAPSFDLDKAKEELAQSSARRIQRIPLALCDQA